MSRTGLTDKVYFWTRFPMVADPPFQANSTVKGLTMSRVPLSSTRSPVNEPRILSLDAPLKLRPWRLASRRTSSRSEQYAAVTSPFAKNPCSGPHGMNILQDGNINLIDKPDTMFGASLPYLSTSPSSGEKLVGQGAPEKAEPKYPSIERRKLLSPSIVGSANCTPIIVCLFNDCFSMKTDRAWEAEELPSTCSNFTATDAC
mmetsp:Transcript_1133/g.7363  ORF Transcript_1133/g.7363 Transcript_1133/m.7363 type:complete len:202 (+) Transcript_1133:4186-4791(+)